MHYFYEEKSASVQAWATNRLAYGSHIHSHIEMVLMEAGHSGVAVDFEEHTLAEGDVLLVFPNQVHRYHDDETRRCLLLIFPPQLVPEFGRVFRQQLPAAPILCGAGRSAQVRALYRQAIAATGSNAPYGDSLFKGYLLALLSLLFASATFVSRPASEPETIKRVLNYCAEHYTEDLILEDVAAAMHLNRHYLSHLFQQKLHMGFRAYINMLRVSEACHLLRQDEHTITEIAFMLGFNSTRSFNRVFLAQQGQAPRAYRAAV